MIALTQTLLSAFGVRVVSPSTGVLRHNGENWGATEPLSPWGDAVAEG